MPLSLLSTKELEATFLAPRGLYIPLVAVAIIVGEISLTLIRKKSPLLVFVLGLFLVHIFALRQNTAELIEMGRERKAILDRITNLYPDLPDRVLFYTKSDRSYYGLPTDEQILPFQSGFGQSLLVWYQRREKFPRDFFADRFLWEITDQGYKEAQGRGFGYFRDIDKMAALLRERNIPLDSIIALSYHSDSKFLEDITRETRANVQKVR